MFLVKVKLTLEHATLNENKVASEIRELVFDEMPITTDPVFYTDQNQSRWPCEVLSIAPLKPIYPGNA